MLTIKITEDITFTCTLETLTAYKRWEEELNQLAFSAEHWLKEGCASDWEYCMDKYYEVLERGF